MNYVEHLNLFGVEAKEIPCIKGSGAPTNSTVGAVGLLYMDTDNGDVYKCIAVTEGSYTWVDIGGGNADNAVLYTEQKLTEEQKAQAMENIGVEWYTTHSYCASVPYTVNVGVFSKVGWKFYTEDWAAGYSYAKVSVEEGATYKISGYGNENAQAVMFFSGEPAQYTYITSIGDPYWEYIDYEITVPKSATVMLVQSAPNKAAVSVTQYTKRNLPITLYGKMYWEIHGDELMVVSKYDAQTDLVVKFGKRGPNNLPDFKSFSTCTNESRIPSSGQCATEFIKNVTDWHGPFQIAAANNADGDKGISYHYTGGNHNYNNVSEIGEGLATARCGSMVFIIDGCETSSGSGYSDNIKAVWENYVQGYNTTKADGTGREIIKEMHELIFKNGTFESSGYIEPLETVNIDSYYGYQLYGLNVDTAFNRSIAFIGGVNRKESTNISVDNESGNSDCQGVIVKGEKHTCRLTLDTGYDLGKRELYDGTKGFFNSKYQKAYSFLMYGAYNIEAGNRYYSRAKWEFYPSSYNG